jgi:tRNA-2-methylthio-N6-dimethylallyladenosine synthase
MNRKHTGAEYLELVARVRTARPDMAHSRRHHRRLPRRERRRFRGDARHRAQGRLRAGLSPSSTARAPARPAAAMDRQVSEADKVDRLARLKACSMTQQSSPSMPSASAACCPCCSNGAGAASPASSAAARPTSRPCTWTGLPRLIGQVVPVEIVRMARNNSLRGKIVTVRWNRLLLALLSLKPSRPISEAALSEPGQEKSQTFRPGDHQSGAPEI